MSLVQHVSAVEGIDREPDSASVQLGRRLSHTLSYDPLPVELHAPPEKLDEVGAYEISAVRRTAQVVVGVITCILASGIVFGFAALKSVLVQEGVYRDLCTEDELSRGLRLCYLQDQRLNLTFIIASVTTNVSALIVGACLDRFGPRACGLSSCLLLSLGSLCMAFAAELPFDAYVVGHFFLAFGGTFIFVPSFHLSNAFPKLQGLILALITGAFDASAAIFLLFRLLNESTDGAFGLQEFFLIYLTVPLFICVTQISLMPARSYESRLKLATKLEFAEDVTRDVHDSDDEIDSDSELRRLRSQRALKRKESRQGIRQLLGSETQQDEHGKKEDEKRIISGVWGALHGVPALQQVRTPWFIFITLFTVLQMARFNFFISTIWSQYKYMLDSSVKASELNEFFDWALPIGGVVTVPFIGLLLDNTSMVVILALLVLLSTVIGLLGAIPTIWAAYANVCLFVVFRPLYYSAMSDYAAKVFGFATFGTVYGTIIFLSGLFTFTQSALQALVHDMFQQDPGPVNLWLAAFGLITGVALVMYVDRKGRVVQQQLFSEEGERRSLLPNSRRPSLTAVREIYNDNERRPLLPKTSRQDLLPPVQEAATER